MGKFCSNCGKEMQENFNMCPNCGTPNGGNTTIINNYNTTSKVVLSERNIVLAIILSFITCSIYNIYWFIVMTDEANKVSGDTKPSGGMAFLFNLITCGIYGIYWNYKMGKKLYQAKQIHGKEIADNSILFLVLSILGLGIVNYCIIQSDLNQFSK